MGLRKKRSIWNWNRNYGRRDAAFTTETGVFKRYLPAGGGPDFGCLFMPASAEQRVPWKNRGAQKRLINRNINKYMKINFTSFLVTEGLIYAAIVAALVGLSGCGKSTILRLLLRFYAPTEGEILINGIPLEKISFRELHQRITFLEQHPRRLWPDPENGWGKKIKLLFFSRVCYTFGRTRKKENNNGK